MAAATITTSIVTHEPDREEVVLTASDGETYVSRKFGTVLSAKASWMEDMGTSLTPVSCAVSEGTVTLHMDGVAADKLVALSIVGNIGN